MAKSVLVLNLVGNSKKLNLLNIKSFIVLWRHTKHVTKEIILPNVKF